MKKYFLLLFIAITTFIKGQSLCNPTYSIGEIFYPNSTSTPTNYVFSRYLCGPNTIVYDTVAVGCNYLYVNSGCTLFFKLNCSNASDIWVKNGGTLNIIPGIGSLIVYYEPLAVINNTSSAPTSSTLCSSITFPTVNCIANALNENNVTKDLFEIYPNPAKNNLSVKIFSNEKSRAQIITMGQVVKEIDSFNTDIDIKDLPVGVYIFSLSGQNSPIGKKYFVISR